MALIGKLSETPFADLVQLYVSSGQTVSISIHLGKSKSPDGVFFVERGQLVDGRFGEAVGRSAVRRALRLHEGSFRVESNVRSTARTVSEAWPRLVLEELVHLDEERRTGRGPEPVAAAPASSRAVHRRGPGWAVRVGVAFLLLVVVAAATVYLKRGRAPGSMSRATPAGRARASTPSPGGASGVDSATSGGGLAAITLGMASPLNGANKELGLGLKAGLEAAVAEANEAGGVHGRRLALLTLDDGNEPDRTVEVVRELLDGQGSVAIVGEASSMSPELSPLVAAKRVPWLGTFAVGAGPSADRYLFGLGPSPADETAAAVRYLVETRHLEASQLAFFGEDDDLGEEGFRGVGQQLRAYRQDPGRVLRTRYRRNSADVEQAVERLRAAGRVRAVVMVATQGPASRLIQRVAEASPSTLFTDVSFVDLGPLAEDLRTAKALAPGNLLVTQSVPPATSPAPALERYRAALAKYSLGELPGSFSLEGYLLGRMLVEALRTAGPAPDPERLLGALETLQLDVGAGPPLGFSAHDHQASHLLWGAVLEASGAWKAVDLR